MLSTISCMTIPMCIRYRMKIICTLCILLLLCLYISLYFRIALSPCRPIFNFHYCTPLFDQHATYIEILGMVLCGDEGLRFFCLHGWFVLSGIADSLGSLSFLCMHGSVHDSLCNDVMHMTSAPNAWLEK